MIKMALDDTDKKLLRELQENCKQSTRKLAKKLGIHSTTVLYRMNKLEKEGFIKRYTAVLDPKKFGQKSTAFVMIKVNNFMQKGETEYPIDRISKKLQKIESVSEIHIMVGEFDIMLKVRGESLEDIAQFMIDNFRDFKSGQKIETIAIFRSDKETLDVKI